MIVQIEGRLLEATPLAAVVDVQGVGYLVHIPVTTAEKLPRVGERTRLFVAAVYREDSQALYGFTTREERDFFRLVTEKVSGVGPRIGLALFSQLSLPTLRAAIWQGNVTLLSQCPGIGRKTAERICLDLRNHVGGGDGGNQAVSMGGVRGGTEENPFADAVAALVALGFKPDGADRAVRKAAEGLGPGAATQELVKAALK